MSTCLVCSSLLTGYRYHNLLTVVMLTAVGYDYGELWTLLQYGVLSSVFSVLTFSNEVPLWTIHKVFSLTIFIDRIHLGWQTPGVSNGDMLLITPQNNPWTWVSAVYPCVYRTSDRTVASGSRLSIVIGSLSWSFHPCVSLWLLYNTCLSLTSEITRIYTPGMFCIQDLRFIRVWRGPKREVVASYLLLLRYFSVRYR